MNNDSSNSVLADIRERLNQAFHPTILQVHDNSLQHINHSGAKEGHGHFTIQITSDAFVGKTQIVIHRMIYKVLDDLMKTKIHALRIMASAPEK